MTKSYNNLTTDELLDLLPDMLCVARKSHADENDRFRIYNRNTEEYARHGFSSARELIIHMLDTIDIQRNETN